MTWLQCRSRGFSHSSQAPGSSRTGRAAKDQQRHNTLIPPGAAMPPTSYPPHPLNRTRLVRFLVADDEYEDMARRAQREGRSLAAYLRERALSDLSSETEPDAVPA